jgi:hypothetical protein
MPTIKDHKQAKRTTRYAAIVRLGSQGKVLQWEMTLEDPAELARHKRSTTTWPIHVQACPLPTLITSPQTLA